LAGAAEGSQKRGGTEERGLKGQSGSGVLGEGAASPHQVGGRLGEQWKLSSGVQGKAMAEIDFCVFYAIDDKGSLNGCCFIPQKASITTIWS